MKDGYFPLTTAQHNIWLNEQFYSGSAINVIHGSLWLDEPIDTELLQQAVHAVMDHNDIFRLAFTVESGEPVQYLTDVRGSHCAIRPMCTPAQARALMDKRSVTPLAFDENILYDLCIYPLDNSRAVLSICLHHILLDGYGMRLLCDQIITAYGEWRGGKAVNLPESQFLESIPLAEDNIDTYRSFWQEYLSGLPVQPVLAHGKAASLDRFTRQKGLDDSLGDKIDRFARDHQLPPYTIFAAALGIYLGRVGQIHDSVIVLPRLGRSGPSLKTLGIYTLAVPLRIKISDHMTFRALCRQIKNQGHAISQHKEYGYSRILSDLKSCGQLEGNLSEFTLNFQKGSLNGILPARLDFSACGAMGNHITLNVSGGSRYQIDYDCRSDLISEQRLDFFHDSLVQIITEALSGTSLAELPVLGPEEGRYLQTISQGTTLPYDPWETIVSLFHQAAARYPERPAVIDSHCRLNFRELDALSDDIAQGLLRQGVQPEQLVAFMLPRTARIVACMLGILKAGGAFLPIDPQYPAARIDYMLEDSTAVLLISDAALSSARERNYIRIDDLLDQGVSGSVPGSSPVCSDRSADLPAIGPDQAAYCIYTSGTTGQPKGVLIEHHGIVNITRPDNNPFNRDICQHGTGIVAIGSICFDISIFEIFVPLLNGLFVVMAPEDALADPLAIAGLLTANGANILHCTPTRLSAYLTESSFCSALSGVEVILSAGEVLPRPMVETLKDGFGVRIYNGYGPTETTIGATITEAGDDISIGRPIANTFIRIADGSSREMPLGTAGEILVGGHGVGRGYLNRPELNREKFVEIEGQRMYRTGDVGYLLEDGRLMYQGRTDTQVKLRGLRIELAEIENCLRQHDEISMCAVIVREISGQQHLAAFYSAPREIPAADLKKHLSLHLAPYMVPDVLVFMNPLPVTSNGKIDLAALRGYYLDLGRPYRPPATQEETALCSIFAEVLQSGKIGADDNFFELGGTSLLAAKIMLQARGKGISLAYADIFKNPTPAMLAAVSGLKDISPGSKSVTSPGSSSDSNPDSNPANTTAETDGAAEDSLATLDYSLLNPVLARNREAVNSPPRSLGNVLITGATGFLGVHILKELIDHPESVDKIYCLIRPKGQLGSEKRLQGTLFYYFEEIDPGLCANRLFAVEGDITRDNLLTAPLDVPINTVIHSAANVSHFAYGDTLQQVNTSGAQNVIHFAEQQGAALIHISTLSVGGCATAEQIDAGMFLDEAGLYIGQRIFNAYIMSKYLAEYHLLQAAARGLPVKIMRVGNLQGRLSDGEFQMNLGSNAFARHLKSYALMKCAPARLQAAGVNFSPVDDTARAIYLLAGSSEQNTVFHTFNPASADYGALFAAMEKFGFPVKWIADREFDELVEKLAQDEATQTVAQGILMEQPDMHWREVPCSSALTASVLNACGFAWGDITRDYLEKYFYALDSLGFFDI